MPNRLTSRGRSLFYTIRQLLILLSVRLEHLKHLQQFYWKCYADIIFIDSYWFCTILNPFSLLLPLFLSICVLLSIVIMIVLGLIIPLICDCNSFPSRIISLIVIISRRQLMTNMTFAQWQAFLFQNTKFILKAAPFTSSCN